MQPFNWNMDHFKFNFLSQGQLGSLSISKMLLAMSNSLVTIFLHLLLQLSAEIVLIPVDPPPLRISNDPLWRGGM